MKKINIKKTSMKIGRNKFPPPHSIPTPLSRYVSMPALSMHVLTHNLSHKCR